MKEPHDGACRLTGGPIKGRITRERWITHSGWEVSVDRDEEVIITPLEPVLDARAAHEGRPPRFGFDPTAYREFRRECDSAGDQLPPEAIEQSLDLLASRKIHVFAQRVPDGRVAFQVCADKSVPQPIVDDFGRLLELELALYSDVQSSLRALIRQRFPKLTGVEPNDLAYAAWKVLCEPAAWREEDRDGALMSPEDRGKYLAAAAWNAIQRRRGEDTEATPGPVAELTVRRTSEGDPAAAPPDQLARLIEKDLATEVIAKILAMPNLRDEERQLLESIPAKAANLSEALRVANLPDSYRVNLLNKIKRDFGK